MRACSTPPRAWHRGWPAGVAGRLWALVVVLAVVSTAVLSLDTTAVLLTPVVIALARHTRTPPLPFALAVLALANTASLVLPVSNLTNLLADHTFRAAGVDYLGLMWAPALAAIGVTVAVLAVRDRRSLGGSYDPAPAAPGARPDPARRVRGRGRRARDRVRRRRTDRTRRDRGRRRAARGDARPAPEASRAGPGPGAVADPAGGPRPLRRRRDGPRPGPRHPARPGGRHRRPVRARSCRWPPWAPSRRTG